MPTSATIGHGAPQPTPFLGVRGACQSPGRPPPPVSQRAGTRHRTYSPVGRVAGWLPSLLAAALSVPSRGPGRVLRQDACLARRVSAALAKLSVVRFSTHPWPQSLRFPSLRPVAHYSVGWDLPPAPTRCFKLPRDGGPCLIPQFPFKPVSLVSCLVGGSPPPLPLPRYSSPCQGPAGPHHTPLREVPGRRPDHGEITYGSTSWGAGSHYKLGGGRAPTIHLPYTNGHFGAPFLLGWKKKRTYPRAQRCLTSRW